MWEDFMRGNWPAAAPPPADMDQVRQELAETRTDAVRPRAAHAMPAHAHANAVRPRRTTARAGTGRGLAGRLAAAFGGALMLTVALPAAALAGDAQKGLMLPGPFVALGDSYASGPLIPDSPVGSPAGCLRSDHNYSADAAAQLGATYIDVACYGARVSDMTTAQSVPLGTAPPQFNALAADDSVVTLTIGGNDIGFNNILKTCGLLSVTNPFGDPCEKHYTSGGTDQLAVAIKAAAPEVAATLASIRQRAPQARVFLVGYPDILPVSGHGCFPLVPLAWGDVAYLRGTEVALNQMLASAAAAGGATYVDTYTATIGHDACASASRRDVEGLVPTSPAYPFHPNERGEQVMAGQLLTAIGT